jgi:hypothetical protein
MCALLRLHLPSPRPEEHLQVWQQEGQREDPQVPVPYRPGIQTKNNHNSRTSIKAINGSIKAHIKKKCCFVAEE